MPEILIPGKRVNFDALDTALQTAIGGPYQGLSAGPYGVRIHLDKALPANQEAAIRQLVTDHNPDTRSAKQIAIEQQYQRMVDAAQSSVGVSIDSLTPVQRNDLLILILYQLGAIDMQDGTIAPLAQWVTKR